MAKMRNPPMINLVTLKRTFAFFVIFVVFYTMNLSINIPSYQEEEISRLLSSQRIQLYKKWREADDKKMLRNLMSNLTEEIRIHNANESKVQPPDPPDEPLDHVTDFVHPTMSQLYMDAQPNVVHYPCMNITTRKAFGGVNSVICTYFPYEDTVSARIHESGELEAEIAHSLEALFQRDPELNFIDLGCHIGYYSIVAASCNRYVLAVDSNLSSLKRLRKSVDLSKYSNLVLTVWNALGKERKLVRGKYPKGNVAARYFVDAPNSLINTMGLIPMIRVSDLIEAVPFNKAVLRLNLNGAEPDMLEHMGDFLLAVRIPYVIISIKYYMFYVDKVDHVIKWFRLRGYVMYEAFDGPKIKGFSINQMPNTFCMINREVDADQWPSLRESDSLTDS